MSQIHHQVSTHLSICETSSKHRICIHHSPFFYGFHIIFFQYHQNYTSLHTVCTPSLPSCWGWGWGGKHPTKFSSRVGCLIGSQFFEQGVAGKEGGGFFQGRCSFYIKNNIKPEIFPRPLLFFWRGGSKFWLPLQEGEQYEKLKKGVEV